MTGSDWWADNVIDVRPSFPGSRIRPTLDPARLEAIIIHRIWMRGSSDEDAWRNIADFWREDPEGVATTTVPGSYARKIPLIRKWRREGVPSEDLARAFCPYHLIVDRRRGWFYQALGLHQRGAHTRGWNYRSIAVAAIGDYRTKSEAQGEQVPGHFLRPQTAENIRMALRDLLAWKPDLRVLTHSQAEEERAAANGMVNFRARKRCPGESLQREIPSIESWARLAASHIREGSSRR